MKILYDNLNIQFIMDNVSFQTLNIAKEQFFASVPKHSHGDNSYEIHYVTQGYGIVMIDDIAYDVFPNSLYITGPYVEHEQIPFPSNPMVEYSCFFTMKKQKFAPSFFDLLLTPPYAEHLFLISKEATDLQRLFELIFSEFKSQNGGYLLQISALLQQCIITSLRYLFKKDVPKHSDVVAPNLSDRRVFITDKAFLYEYSTLTLPKLSERLGISIRQTERFLQQNYKKCFSEKLLEARMSAAIILLNRKNLSLFDVAEKVGYSSVEYFSNRFKKYYHISPRKYRQRQHSQNQQDSRVGTKKLTDK